MKLLSTFSIRKRIRSCFNLFSSKRTSGNKELNVTSETVNMKSSLIELFCIFLWFLPPIWQQLCSKNPQELSVFEKDGSFTLIVEYFNFFDWKGTPTNKSFRNKGLFKCGEFGACERFIFHYSWFFYSSLFFSDVFLASDF